MEFSTNVSFVSFCMVISFVVTLFAEEFPKWTQIENIDLRYIPKGWKYNRAANSSKSITLTIAIKQSHIQEFHEKLLSISHPLSDEYGQHMTINEIGAILQPSDETITDIEQWLLNSDIGITSDNLYYSTPNKDILKVNGITIEQANQLLHTQYSIWTQSISDNKDIREHLRVKDHYYVPSNISKYIDFISPTLRFPFIKHIHSIKKINKYEFDSKILNNKNNNHSDNNIEYNTPKWLYDLYGINNTIIGSNCKSELMDGCYNSQSFLSMLDEWFYVSDLQTFWDYFNLSYCNLTKIPYFQPPGNGTEASLDVQYITALGREINTISWDVEDSGDFSTLLEQLQNSDNIPLVMSMSYGGDEQADGYEYCSRVSIEFGKVSALGVTFFASSGDHGACGNSGVCGYYGEFLPSFPASSPYVTAVGGTFGGSIDSSGLNTNEIGWFNSGGGFSSFFDRESWQDTSVLEYLNTCPILPNSEIYNSNGRGFPDISAQSVDYIIVDSDDFVGVSGTSASTPVVAGIFALINDYRLANGKSSLGWLNPALYHLYDNDNRNYFNDVTTGYNEGCDSGVAFTAQEGWDPVTGLGTPKFQKLLSGFMKAL